MSGQKLQAAVHAAGRTKMTLPERQAVEKEVRDLDAQLRGGGAASGDPTENRPDMLQNRPALLARKKKLEDLLNMDEDLVAKPGDRARLSAEAKAIEERVGKNMLTERERTERMTGKRSQEYESAVQKTVFQQRQNLKDLQRWQEIMRQLYPDDPTACDIRRIKPR
jgi:hypothetical protein